MGCHVEIITHCSFGSYNYFLGRHYNDVIMGTMTSQITSLKIVYSVVIQAQIKENINALHHWPLCGELTGVNSPHKGPVTRKMFPFDDVIMIHLYRYVISFHFNLWHIINNIMTVSYVIMCLIALVKYKYVFHIANIMDSIYPVYIY